MIADFGLRPEPRWVQGSPALNVVQGGLRIVGARGARPLDFFELIQGVP